MMEEKGSRKQGGGRWELSIYTEDEGLPIFSSQGTWVHTVWLNSCSLVIWGILIYSVNEIIVMCYITKFSSMTDQIYDGGPINLSQS